MKRNVSPWLLFSSIGSAFILACFAYLYVFQSPNLGRREVASAFIVFLALIPAFYLLFSRFLAPKLGSMPGKTRFAWLAVSAIVGVLGILTTTQPEYFFAILPRHSVEIAVAGEAKDSTVTLHWFSNDLGDVSFDRLQKTGSWEITSNGYTHRGGGEASLAWSGPTGETAWLQFESSGSPSTITVTWDGEPQTIPVPSTAPPAAGSQFTFPVPIVNPLAIYFVTWFAISLLFLVITIFLSNLSLKPAVPHTQGKWNWLFFSLPMILVWSVYLLTFYPGIITPDGINQWGQIQTGRLDDALPVGHTLLLILITGVCNSPAAVIISQIIFLSLTTAWGLGILMDQGLPKWAGWLLAVIFAVSPVNARMVITLWKDIPYSVCLLLLSLMVLKIFFTKGDWLRSKSTWLWIGLVSLGISSFRLNGLPVPVVTLVILAAIYKKWWKPLIGTLVSFLAVFTIIQGPVFDQLKVDRNEGFKQLLFIHHIAAHVVEGGPLTEGESAMASKIFPLDEWAYDCCTNLRVWRTPSFSEPRFAEESETILELFLQLAIKEPIVEARHFVCVSSLIWELPSRCKLNVEPLPSGEIHWITRNSLGLREESLIPSLVQPFTLIDWRISQTPLDLFFYTPALFLYLAVYCTSLFALRRKDWKGLLFITPALVQSSVMIVVNVSRDFRYQYGVFLIGLFSLGLLILGLSTSKQEAPGSTDSPFGEVSENERN